MGGQGFSTVNSGHTVLSERVTQELGAYMSY